MKNETVNLSNYQKLAVLLIIRQEDTKFKKNGYINLQKGLKQIYKYRQNNQKAGLMEKFIDRYED